MNVFRYRIVIVKLPVDRESRAVINTDACDSPDTAQEIYNKHFIPKAVNVSVYNRYLNMDETFQFAREGGWRHK